MGFSVIIGLSDTAAAMENDLFLRQKIVKQIMMVLLAKGIYCQIIASYTDTTSQVGTRLEAKTH